MPMYRVYVRDGVRMADVSIGLVGHTISLELRVY